MALAVGWLTTTQVQAQTIDADQALNRIVSSMTDYHRKVADQPGRVDKVVTTIHDELTGGKLTETLNISKLDRRSDSALSEVQTRPAPGSLPNTDISWAINEDYGFELGQKSGELGLDGGEGERRLRRTFLVSDEIPTEYEGQYKRPSERADGPPRHNIASLDGLVHISLPQLRELRGFAVGDCRFFGEDQSEIEIQFEYDGQVPSNKAKRYVPARISCVLKVAANHYCLPISFTQNATRSGEQYRYQGSWERGFVTGWTGQDRGLVAEETHIGRTTVDRDGAKVVDYKRVVTREVSYGRVPPEEFRLSAFGFPEPKGFERMSNPWPMRLAGLGLLFVAAAVLLRLHRTRRQ